MSRKDKLDKLDWFVIWMFVGCALFFMFMTLVVVYAIAS